MKDLFEYCVGAGFALLILVTTYSYLTDLLTTAVRDSFSLVH